MKQIDLYKEETTLLDVKSDNELDRMIGKLRPINQFTTFFYGVKIN